MKVGAKLGAGENSGAWPSHPHSLRSTNAQCCLSLESWAGQTNC